MNIEVWSKVDTFVRDHDLDSAVRYLEECLNSCESPRFKSLLRSDFKNDPVEIAVNVSEFIDSCRKKFNIEAVYLEMNGFAINPDRWFFDFFGYDKYIEDPDDLDWLSDWNSDAWPAVTLTGLEAAQEDYAWYMNESGHEEELADMAEEYSTLLIVCKFAKLIGRAMDTGEIGSDTPILATAHDFDIIARFIP